jgi:hypothetical protein
VEREEGRGGNEKFGMVGGRWKGGEIIGRIEEIENEKCDEV